MKRKQLLAGGVAVLCAGLAVFALIKFHPAGKTSDPDDAAQEENVPSVVSVQTGTLKRLTLHQYVNSYGMIEPAPATKDEPAAGAQLAAPGAAVVYKVNVIAGQHVEKGDVLIELDSSTATSVHAKAEVERQKQLFAQKNASLKTLQDAEAQLAGLQVTSPISGTMTRLSARPGEAVDANMVIAEVVDLNRLAASAKIPSAEAGEVTTGAEVQIPAAPEVKSSLFFVSPAVDGTDGTVLTRALLPENSGLRPGQFVQLKIVTAIHTNCLAAPLESVVTDEDGKSVISLVKGEEAIRTPVKTGLREDGWVEVEAPELKEGASIVTTGTYGLPEKTKIHVENSASDSSTNSPEAQ